MTGEIVGFGGRKPSKVEDEKALADAKACVSAHDPLLPVFDLLDRSTSRIEAAVKAINTASPLNDDQVKALTYATERAAERGVGMYATRIGSWHQAIVAGVFVAGLAIGIFGTSIHYQRQIDADQRQTDAREEAMRLEVPGVLAAVPASDLAEWTTLIRANPPPHALIAAGRTAPQPNGQRAVTISLWLEPPPRTPASVN